MDPTRGRSPHGVPVGLVVLSLHLVTVAQSNASSWTTQGVISDSASPHARLHSVPICAVKMGPGFWSARIKVNAEQSIPTLLEQLEDHGVVDNFRRLSDSKRFDRRGRLSTDADLYKWMEAVAYVLQSGPRPELEARMDRLTDEILAAQEPSGYLNTYWSQDLAEKRFTEMQRSHELYCLGHLLQAGIAYYRATGNRKLLNGGIRFANYMVENFGPTKRPALAGHPVLEIPLSECYIPSLTTVDMHPNLFLGQTAASALLELCTTGKSSDREYWMPLHLVEGHSTGPVSAEVSEARLTLS